MASDPLVKDLLCLKFLVCTLDDVFGRLVAAVAEELDGVLEADVAGVVRGGDDDDWALGRAKVVLGV